MKEFTFLKIINFDHQLKIYELMSTSIQKEISDLESKNHLHKLTKDEARNLEFYTQSLDILIKSTFLQIYAQLEESLYHECEQQDLKKNASIVRFETALSEQGFNIEGEYWRNLLEIAKIRNCLLHGNGRLDSDRYGEDTRETINSLNSDAKTILIEIIDLKGHRKGSSKIKIKNEFLPYCINLIKNFINSQK